jgi:tRNA pseudouridine38-40 synthase
VIKLTLAYDGTSFVGWQRQANGVSIQQLVEGALEPVEGRPVAVIGAGRTDAGVHALGQVATVPLTASIDTDALARALNARLPDDVRVLDVAEAPPEFHARFSARAKRYRYRIVNAPVQSPFERRYAWHVPQPLDLDAMRRAAGGLVGRHDFAAFQAAGSAVASTERTLFNVECREAPLHFSAPVGPHPHSLALGGAASPRFPAAPRAGRRPVSSADSPASRGRAMQARLIEIEIRGDGFLRHMVRNIGGTLVEVGHGRRSPESVADTLASRDRSRAGPTAPAHGLFLVDVEY